MAFEGNVKDFGLSEIFQLIALQKKSGMLSISGEENVVIFFREGVIISTRDRRNKTHDPLKDYLLRYGFIGRDDMNKIQQVQAETNLDLTDILLSERHFSEDELKTIFTAQIQETLHEVLSWPQSHYKFIIGMHVLHGIISFASLKVEGLLMESMRRIDEFPELLRIFPSEDMTIRQLAMPPENPPELNRNEEIIYELLEDELSLGELIISAKMARFCTYETLKSILEKGLLEIIKDSAPTAEESVQETAEKTKDSRKRLVPTFAAVCLLLAFFFIGEYIVPMVLPSGKGNASTIRRGDSFPVLEGYFAGNMKELKLRQLEVTIREGLEEYFAYKGTYPFTLEILAVRNYVPKKTIEQVYQSDLRYRLGNNSVSYMLVRK